MHVVHTCSNDREPILQVIYDIMVCAVGETTATFGVPGVMEHCYFMKAGAHSTNPLTRSQTHRHMLNLFMPQLLQPQLAAPLRASSPHVGGARAQEVTDTVGLRRRIGESFELAALPGTTEEDRRKALHFCVVGGGPTGVEFAGTLRDFVRGDLSRKYPELMADVQVRCAWFPLLPAQSPLQSSPEWPHW